MRVLRLSNLIVSVLVVSLLASGAEAAGPLCRDVFTSETARLAQEKAEWAQLSESEKRERRREELYRPSTSLLIERRPIIKTSGNREDSVGIDPADFRVDTADPSLVMPIQYPNGATKYRINFSGLRYIEADRPADLFRPGVGTVKRSRGFYKDGTEMVGSYHNEAWPWDVVIYKNDAGEQIALGGVMRQTTPGRLPNVSRDNSTRSRWWGKVSHVELSPGVFEEHIVWQGPIHDFNVNEHQGWEYHGYGGTLLTAFNPKTGLHEPIKNSDGTYTLMYERVTEEQHGLPWITTTFMRKMDPSLKKTVGPEIAVTNMISPVTGQIFEALRRGADGDVEGYLREGDNVLKERKYNQFIKAGSANDYVRKYGIYLDYRDPGADPLGPFKNVVDENGQLIDFAQTLGLREMMNATWVGRPQLNYDPNGNLWLLFHFVPKETIPPGGPVMGWPSAEDFPKYARITAMLPVKIIHDKQGQPRLVKDIEPDYAYKYAP